MQEVISDLTQQRSRFLAFVERRVHDHATAEDILQGAYIRAVSQAASLQSNDSANAWFFRILRNAVIDHYRHHAVEERTFESWTPEIDPPANSVDLAPATPCGCVHGALDKIQPTYSEVLREVDLAETSLDSFAQRSGITTGNAAVRAHRARRALHKQLLHTCGVCAQAGCQDCSCHHG
ncbi:RNA polymerase sigma factor [Edaphobacter albus]|uniref:RNA polymerase sigma factor n=1 Tax=Edaphobacter sp. 4G125 TaxID=2763071 RepID=UPI001648A1B2|nr:RNA polymerase sigma factor [Edaphobacter sp. 4G125]QNI35247.1 sigma-70 family RNA polymerase sigma factor [Edaphobacter sp. 4G125]